MIKLLFFGDIYGRPGREVLDKVVPELKKKYDPDFVFANGENMAHGKGYTERTIDECKGYGIEFFTSGNHTFDKKDVMPFLEDKNPIIIRPANYPPGTPGLGYKKIQIRTAELLVVNLMGRVHFREDLDCPFRKIDSILEENKDVKAVFVDFHAEATSEMIAMKHHLNGRASVVVGTHTHVPTEDHIISPEGTYYVTDVGMTGPADSVIGVEKEIILKRFLTQLPIRMEVADTGKAEVNAVYIEIDSDGKAQKFEKISETVDL